LTVAPTSGAAPLPVTADATNSTDNDTYPIASYKFDFGDATPSGPQAAGTASHTYTAAGTYTITVTVTDTAGESSQAKATVTVGPAHGANQIGNPGFETNTSGWNTGGRAGITLTQVAGGHSGSFAAALTNTTSAKAADCTLNDSPDWVKSTFSGTYTASLWVRADAPGAKLNLRVREYQGSTNEGSKSTTVTLSTTWQQVTLSYTPQISTGGEDLDFTAYLSNAAPGNCFYADDASESLN
jgi:PKD repeat protein